MYLLHLSSQMPQEVLRLLLSWNRLRFTQMQVHRLQKRVGIAGRCFLEESSDQVEGQSTHIDAPQLSIGCCRGGLGVARSGNFAAPAVSCHQD